MSKDVSQLDLLDAVEAEQVTPQTVEPVKYTEKYFIEQLRLKYPKDSYAFLPQVRNATGYQRQVRTADAIVMSLWPSRGLDLMGFEIKVSRSDWLKELENPQKAEEIQQYCDRWYIVAPSKVVKINELPKTWGLIVPHGNGLNAKVPAPLLTPNPISKGFLASLLRVVSEAINPADQLAIERDKGWKEGYEYGLKNGNQQLERLSKDHDQLLKVLKDFEQASGVTVNQWGDGGNIGRAFKIAMEGERGVKDIENRLIGLKEQADRIQRWIAEDVNTLLKSRG